MRSRRPRSARSSPLPSCRAGQVYRTDLPSGVAFICVTLTDDGETAQLTVPSMLAREGLGEALAAFLLEWRGTPLRLLDS